MPPNFGDYQVMVAGNPDLGRWAVRCHGPQSYLGYACDTGYGLDRVGRVNEDYMDATAHAGARDIHFKMYKMANVDRAHNGPLDWMGLFEALFGGLLLPEGVSITLPRALLEKRVTTAIVFFGTKCPGFSFKQGQPAGGGSETGGEVPTVLGGGCYRMADLFRGAFLSMETGRRVWGRAGGELEVTRWKGGKSFVPL